MPIEISVSIVAARCRAFRSAARWNAEPAQKTTGVASASASHSQPSNWSGGTIASTTSGAVRTHGDDEPRANRAGRRRRARRRVLRQRGVVAGGLDRGDQVVDRDGAGIERDGRLLGRVVDGRLDAVELVELPLDARRARGAGHALELEVGARCLLGCRRRVIRRPRTRLPRSRRGSPRRRARARSPRRASSRDRRSTDSTPGTADTSSSTAATQWPQCIPGTTYRRVSMASPSVWDPTPQYTPIGYEAQPSSVDVPSVP